MKKTIILPFLLLFTVICFGQIPQFTKDINTQYQSSNPTEFHKHDSNLFFTATNDLNIGAELWKTDGTAAGTVLLNDIYVGSQSSRVSDFTSADSLLFFTANDGVHGTELWKTEGTSASTALVKDIRPGTTASGVSNLTYFAAKKSVVFTANDGTNGSELWISDGTDLGTQMIKDIRTGSVNTAISTLTVSGDYCYFIANDGLSGNELWRTDGTTAGTFLLKDIRVGGVSSSPSLFTTYGGMLYFKANDGTLGSELWQTDGTTAGTVLLKDINVGTASANPTSLMVYDNKLFFTANDGVSGFELWTTDGTSAGTALYMDFIPGTGGGAFSDLTICNGTLFLIGSSAGGGREVMRLHPIDTIRELSVNRFGGSTPSNLVCVGDKLFFLASVDNGRELYVSDGTTAGTKLTRDLYPIQTDAFIRFMTVVDSTLYFISHQSPNFRNMELYAATSTQTRPTRVKDIIPGATASNPTNLIELNGELLFTVNDEIHGMELWKSTSTTSADLLVDIYQGTQDARIATMARYKGGVLFNAVTDLGDELWKSNGTENTTTLVDDIYFGSTSSSPRAMFSDRDRVYFMASETATKRLFYSDGTAAGTRWISIGVANKNYVEQLRVGNNLYMTYSSFTSNDLYRYTSGSSGSKVMTINPSRLGDGVRNLTNFNGTLYFTADENANYGNELWKSDGTSRGTEIVKNIRSSRDDSNPSNLLALDSVLLFSANNGSVGSELWGSKGTDATTQLVLDINNGAASSGISQMTYFQNKAYFSATDGTNGRELWVSDGTAAGTSLFLNAAVGDKSSNPTQLIATDSHLYFVLEDSVIGNELWVTDGTTAGTFLLKDIRAGKEGAAIENLTVVRDMIYFTANDSIHGAELWKTDGTIAGTSMVPEVTTGPVGSNPQLLTLSNDTLFYTAYHPDYGVELWYVFTNCMVGGIESASACINDDIAFKDLSNPLGNTISGYRWDFGNGDTALTKNVDYAYSLQGTYTVTLTVETLEGCSVTSQEEVFVDSLPTALFTIANDSSCLENNSFRFTNRTPAASNYSWNFGDGATSDTRNPSHSYTAAGTYTVELTATNESGCNSEITSTVYVLPAPIISAIAGVTESKRGRIDSFSVVSTTGSTYQWAITGGNITEGQGSSKIKVAWRETTTTGFVRVTETSGFGCEGSQFSKRVEMTGLSVPNTPMQSTIDVYPNPFTSQLNYRLDNLDANTNLTILDIAGRELITYKVNEKTGTLNLENLASGVYIVRFLNGGQSQEVRIIKK